MTLKQITDCRLHLQQLARPNFESAADVVSWLGAVQGQDYFGALWSIGQRMKKSVESNIEQAIIDRKIVRTWPMRGTLHFVAPKDVRWMLRYLTPRVIARTAGIYKKAGLEKKDFIKSAKVLEKVLRGGKQLTRDEMYEALERAKIQTDNMRGLHILGHVAMEGLICFGARKGKQQTFTLLDEWLPAIKMITKEEALGELALRYFKSHGPATIEDFMWWAGLTKADATLGLNAVKSNFISETVDQKNYWRQSSQSLPKITQSSAYLLPTYDEYGIGYKDRSAIIDDSTYKKIGGLYTSAIIVSGKVAGVWRRTIKKDAVFIETKLFNPISFQQQQAISKAANKYSRFVGLSLNFKPDFE